MSQEITKADLQILVDDLTAAISTLQLTLNRVMADTRFLVSVATIDMADKQGVARETMLREIRSLLEQLETGAHESSLGAVQALQDFLKRR